MIEIQTNVTLDDLLAILQQGEQPTPGFYTLQEWSIRLGISNRRLRVLFCQAKERGILQCRRERRESLDGIMRFVPVYKISLEGE